MIKTKIRYATKLSLDVDWEKMIKDVGVELADELKSAVKSGRSLTGSPLPKPKTGNPLVDTGETIESIMFSNGVAGVSGFTGTKPRAMIVGAIAKRAKVNDMLGLGSEFVKNRIQDKAKKWLKKNKAEIKPSGFVVKESKR